MKDGEARVTCGTFNVSGRQTTVRMVAAYNLKSFDGWVVMLWDAQKREDRPCSGRTEFKGSGDLRPRTPRT